MEIFLAETKEDVLFFVNFLKKENPCVSLVVLSTLASLVAREMGIEHDFIGKWIGKFPNITREMWREDIHFTDKFVKDFGPFEKPALVGWYTLFKACLALRILRQLLEGLSVNGQRPVKIHAAAFSRVNINAAIGGVLQGTGLMQFYMFFTPFPNVRSVFWDVQKCKTVSRAALYFRASKNLINIFLRNFFIYMPTLQSKEGYGCPPDKYDVVLDLWDRGGIERNFDLGKLDKYFSDRKIKAGYEIANHTVSVDIQQYLTQAPMQVSEVENKPAKEKTLKIAPLHTEVFFACIEAAGRFCVYGHVGKSLYFKGVLVCTLYAILMDGLANLREAGNFFLKYPHYYFIAPVSDNRKTRAEMIISKELGAKQFCLQHGSNLFLEPSALFLGELIVVGGERRKRSIVENSSIPEERIVVLGSSERMFAEARSAMEKLLKKTPKLIFLLSDAHLSWSLCPPVAFNFFVDALAELLTEFEDTIDITVKSHPAAKTNEGDLIDLLFKQRLPRKEIKIVYDVWDFLKWKEYDFCFSLDVISTAIPICGVFGIPVVFFSNPLSATDYYFGLEDVTVPVNTHRDIVDFTRNFLKDEKLRRQFSENTKKITELFYGDLFSGKRLNSEELLCSLIHPERKPKDDLS